MTGIIMQRVQAKIDARKQPSPNDKIVNPLSEFKTVAEKRAAYNVALDKHEPAYLDFNTKITLGMPGAKFNDVEFIGGLWRVQRKFDSRGYEMVEIRGKKFVILKKLDRQEYTEFEYFDAASVNINAYGAYCDFKPLYIVAKAVNEYGTFYSFRCYETSHTALEDARAYLSGKTEQARYLAKQRQR